MDAQRGSTQLGSQLWVGVVMSPPGKHAYMVKYEDHGEREAASNIPKINSSPTFAKGTCGLCAHDDDSNAKPDNAAALDSISESEKYGSEAGSV